MHIVCLPAPPRIIQKTSDVSLGEAETATLECVASGQPKPAITWLRNDLPLPLGDPRFRVNRSDGTLTIAELQTTDRGVYRCMASNELGTVSEFTRLEVFGECIA
jgi:Immunoglobulin domain